MPSVAGKLDPPFLSEDELDALYERDPVEAMRVSRRQAALMRELEAARAFDPTQPAPTAEAVTELLQEARRILQRDGGDIELVALEEEVLSVRLAGNCAGCPRAALDLKHVVERLVRARFPQIRVVRNVGRDVGLAQRPSSTAGDKS